jgi:histidinol-phosphate aminotransferase
MSNIENIEINKKLPLGKKFLTANAYGAPVLDCRIKLNTNENPFNLPQKVKTLILTELDKSLESSNRYPDRSHELLREAIADYLQEITQEKLSKNQVWAANGSNEILQQILQAFSDPGALAVGFEPSYSMHKILSEVNGYQYIAIPRDKNFLIDQKVAVDYLKSNEPRIVFITTPNNPTGTSTNLRNLEGLIEAAPNAIFIVDEAYGEFSQSRSAISLISKYSNLFVTRTMSKAFAFAGARIGYVTAQSQTIVALTLTRLPYHLSLQSQIMARVALKNYKLLQQQVNEIIQIRNWMSTELTTMGFYIVESDANFLLFGNLLDEKALWRALVDESILVRDVGIKGFLRVSVGTQAESKTFVQTLQDLLNNNLIKFA